MVVVEGKVTYTCMEGVTVNRERHGHFTHTTQDPHTQVPRSTVEAQQRTSSVGGRDQGVAERHILCAMGMRACEELGKGLWCNFTHKSHSSKPARATPCDHSTRTPHAPVVEATRIKMIERAGRS